MKPEDFLEKGDEDETTYEQAVKDIEADKVKKQALIDQKKAKDEELKNVAHLHINKFDGLIHGAGGKIIDPVDGHEVSTEDNF